MEDSEDACNIHGHKSEYMWASGCDIFWAYKHSSGCVIFCIVVQLENLYFINWCNSIKNTVDKNLEVY